MKKFKYEGAPLVLAFVLSPMIENALRQSLIMSHGSFMTFLERPLSAVLLALAVGVIVVAVLPAVSRKREVAFAE